MITTQTFTILNAENLAVLADKVEKVNRRLERNGFAERFTFVVAEVEEPAGVEGVFQTHYEVVFNRPSVEIEGWKFVGSVKAEGTGVLVGAAPGEELAGLERPTETRCDHCGHDRARKVSYIIRNTETGEYKIIGSTCIELYFAVEVKGLWLLGEFTQDQIAEMCENRGVAREEMTFDVRTFVRVALAVSDMGRAFKPRAFEDQATVARALTAYFPGRNAEEKAFSRETWARAEAIADAVVDDVLASAQDLGAGDYRDNMLVILGNERVSYRGIGILASIVTVWARVETKRAERQEAAAGFVGAVGERLRGVGVVLTKVNVWESMYGETTQMIFHTDDHHVVLWRASNYRGDVEVGQRYALTATVKDHGEYQGTDQTVVTRARLVTA